MDRHIVRHWFRGGNGSMCGHGNLPSGACPTVEEGKPADCRDVVQGSAIGASAAAGSGATATGSASAIARRVLAIFSSVAAMIVGRKVLILAHTIRGTTAPLSVHGQAMWRTALPHAATIASCWKVADKDRSCPSTSRDKEEQQGHPAGHPVRYSKVLRSQARKGTSDIIVLQHENLRSEISDGGNHPT